MCDSFKVTIPPEVNPADCVASLLPALKIFTAFRQIVRLGAIENILVWCHDDLNSLSIALQLCQLWNYRVCRFSEILFFLLSK